jgi:hypothetical protein
LAKEAYTKATELDPYNIIAQKNLQRLSYLGEMVGEEDDSDHVEPQHFIEETGKTGVVNLNTRAPLAVLAKIGAGDRVYLKRDGAGLSVENGRGEYVGQVEPKHGQRLIKLMGGGNRYSAAIVSVNEERVTVIIREIYQDPSQAGQLSFPPKGTEGLRPYLSDKMLRRELEQIETMADESADMNDSGDS